MLNEELNTLTESLWSIYKRYTKIRATENMRSGLLARHKQLVNSQLHVSRLHVTYTMFAKQSIRYTILSSEGMSQYFISRLRHLQSGSLVFLFYLSVVVPLWDPRLYWVSWQVVPNNLDLLLRPDDW